MVTVADDIYDTCGLGFHLPGTIWRRPIGDHDEYDSDGKYVWVSDGSDVCNSDFSSDDGDNASNVYDSDFYNDDGVYGNDVDDNDYYNDDGVYGNGVDDNGFYNDGDVYGSEQHTTTTATSTAATSTAATTTASTTTMKNNHPMVFAFQCFGFDVRF